MALSELLFKALFPDRCWHEWGISKDTSPYVYSCNKCGVDTNWPDDSNPNLFTPEAFLTVWDAVKDREDWLEGDSNIRMDGLIYKDEIASPKFQLSILEWLNPEGLAEVDFMD
jgi:hypothetical protein